VAEGDADGEGEAEGVGAVSVWAAQGASRQAVTARARKKRQRFVWILRTEGKVSEDLLE
jgi:hypothetical protein